jgi:hypothetical protein
MAKKKERKIRVWGIDNRVSREGLWFVDTCLSCSAFRMKRRKHVEG